VDNVDDLKEVARRIFEQALADCSIERAFDRTMRIEGRRLVLDGDDVLALDRLRRVRVVAIGKAGTAMLSALLARLLLPAACEFEGVLIAGERPRDLPAAIQFFAGGHPVPNEASFAGAAAALSMLRAVGDAAPEETLSIFLISGGASAMMEFPLDPAISLEDTVAFHRALVHSGASIVEINCVRKHFSAVKGGRLALAAGAAQKISLLVSDVPPAHLDALASGPTIADPTTVAECREILARYGLMERFPVAVRQFFASVDLPESPKPGELISRSWKLLDSEEFGELARAHAERLGFHAVIDNRCDDWSYDAAADCLLDRLRQLRLEHPRVCLISAGEVTVRVPSAFAESSDSGFSAGAQATHVGGRNQHFALYAASQLRATDGPMAVLSAGSDGIDGNSDAAGAVVDELTLEGDYPVAAEQVSGTVERVSRRASAERALAEFDSATWLGGVGATVVTGPTGHNLRDLRILLAD
jgi:hydroxypyruvate reductase